MADRRDEIVRKATELFATRGFEATTIREIATAVNILSGSLYHHFATKEDILHRAVTPAIEQLRRRTIAAGEAVADPEIKLVAFVLLELAEQIENHSAHAVLYNERKLFRSKEEFAHVRQAKRDIYDAWRGVLIEGMALDLFDASLDLYQTIRTIIRMLNSAADWFAGGDEATAELVRSYSLAQVQDFYLRFILGAVRAPARAAEPIPHDAATRLLGETAEPKAVVP
jgi:TetR/AcrR family transcriptional regulator, cholesterol catabolism regulator